MKLPGSIPLKDPRYVLRPFGTHRLEKELEIYTKWMADEKLRFETGTDEPMNYEEIRDMQKKWLTDEDKFNFVVWDDRDEVPVGDIGLFYHTDAENEPNYHDGEISMMIADSGYRRKGVGRLAFNEVASWANGALQTELIVAKVKDSNFASIRFFEHLGFVQESHSKVFEEVTLTRPAARD